MVPGNLSVTWARQSGVLLQQRRVEHHLPRKLLAVSSSSCCSVSTGNWTQPIDLHLEIKVSLMVVMSSFKKAWEIEYREI